MAKKRNKKLIIPITFTLFLYGLFLYMFFKQPASEMFLMLFGAILGTFYVFQNGSLPDEFIETTKKSSWLFGGYITSENDPTNIPPKVYLPIIGIALLILIIGYYIATN